MVMSKPRLSAARIRGGDVDLERDRALVRRCQNGDGAAFAELYTEYFDRLHRFCLRRLPDRDDAQEVAQEAFLRAWRAMPTFAGDLRFYPWLTVIAKNLCTDALRRRARYGELTDLDRYEVRDASRAELAGSAQSSEEAVMASFDGQLAAEAMAKLSERHRHVLDLREQQGLTYQQIAAAEGVEVSAVETLLWRARQALKREYSALSGAKVFGGVLGLGAGLRSLYQRLARLAVRAAAAGRAVKLRDLAAAGVVTAALAGVAATSSTQHLVGPVTPATASSTAAAAPAPVAWSQESTPLSVSSGGAGGPSGSSSSAPSSGSAAPSIQGSPVPVGTASVPPATSADPPAGASSSSPLTGIAGEAPAVISKLATTVQTVTGLPLQPNLPGVSGLPPVGGLTGSLPPLPSAPSSVNSAVSGATSLLQKL